MKNLIDSILKKVYPIIASDVFKEMLRLKGVRFSLFGIGLALIFSLMFGTEKSGKAMLVPQPISLPYTKNICANGVVEANSKNIALGVFQSGIIKEIFVKENDAVKKGDLLIQLDDQLLLSQAKAQEAALKAAQAALTFKKAIYQEALDQVNRGQQLKKGVISEEEIKRREFTLERASADIESAEQNIEQAKQTLEMIQTQLEQAKLRAPIDGTILKVYPSVGEFISNEKKTIILGNTTPLHVVAQIDETEIANFDESAKACAIDRSGSKTYIPLKFIKVVPLTSSKTNLSGASNELIDTRIIEVTFEITEPKKLFIGQRLDVFIEMPIAQK
ncbi:MAG: p-hydroxybenzoic acid efflux pump subunit AaeA [Holosporales bacterium]